MRGIRGRRHWSRVSMLAAVVLALSIGHPVRANHLGSVHTYAGQSNVNVQYKGIDGYIRVSASIMQDPFTHFHAHFLNLCPNGSCSYWVQLGGYQGTIAGQITSINSVHMYRENQNPCVGYSISDLGAPAKPNYAYYILYSGVSETVDGCASQKRYYGKVGSFSNPPFTMGWMNTTTGIPIAETEIIDSEDVGVDRFGLNDLAQVHASYAIRLLNASNQWVLWDAVNAPGTATFGTNPFYTQKNPWSAFETHD